MAILALTILNESDKVASLLCKMGRRMRDSHNIPSQLRIGVLGCLFFYFQQELSERVGFMVSFWLGVFLVLLFTLMSGFNDGGNLLATFLNTRTLNVKVAIVMIGAAVIIGPFMLGTAVAETIGTHIINVQKINVVTINIALMASLITLFVSWKLKVPTSTSFALVGGLAGAGFARFGPHVVVWGGLMRVLLSLFIAIVAGGVVGMILYTALLVLLRHTSLHFGIRVGSFQYFSALLQCIGYGANDAEKSVGLLATIWLLTFHESFRVTWWMILLPAGVFVIGVIWGGWSVAKTIGFHVFRARPVHSFVTQLSSALVVIAASAVGGPVSSTQTIDSALIGVGIRAGKERIRWSIVRRLGIVWVFTMPCAFVLACIFVFLERLLLFF